MEEIASALVEPTELFDRRLLAYNSEFLYVDDFPYVDCLSHDLLKKNSFRYSFSPPLSSRLTYSGRLGILAATLTSQQNILLATRNRLLFCNPQTALTKPATITSYRRPYHFCLSSQGLYFGEYHSNQHREPVSINYSRDGLAWDNFYTFPAFTIRHIHTIIDDPYRNGLWVLTGDTDRESRFLFFKDYKPHPVTVFSGNQLYRSTSLVTQENQIIYATDTPFSQNKLISFDTKHRRLSTLANLPSSVFDLQLVNDLLFFTTVPELSHCNNTSSVNLYVLYRNRVFLLSTYSRFHSVHLDPLFQYPRLQIIPDSSNCNIEWLYVFASGTRPYKHSTLRWSIPEIKHLLSNLATH